MSSSAQRLRFLDLPSLIQENILKRVDLIDVVSLSFCSTRASKTINFSRFPNLRDPEGPLTGGGVHVEFRRGRVTVVFQDQIPKCTLKIQTSESGSDSPIYRKVEGFKHSWPFANSDTAILMESHLVADYSPSQFNEAAKRAIEHICYIFRLPVIRVSVNVHEIPNFTTLFIWDLLRGSCTDVQLHGRKCKIQNSEVKVFFNRFRIEKRLALEVENCGGLRFRMDKLQNLDLLVLRNARWMQDHHFEQLNCEFLEIHKTQITAGALKKWLHNWTKSSETKAKVLTVSSRAFSHPLHCNTILQGLTYEMHFEGENESIGKFGSFTRPIYPVAPLKTYCRRVFTVIRADGAVAKITGTPYFCIYLNYN